MSRAVIFVLDTTTGRPAQGLSVRLEHLELDGTWSPLAEGLTRSLGEVPEIAEQVLTAAGEIRFVCATGAYYASRGMPCFYPTIVVPFTISDVGSYVVPLLLGPFGYTTYRGS